MLKHDTVVEYQQIYKSVYGKSISYQAAQDQGEALLRLFDLIRRTSTKATISNKQKGKYAQAKRLPTKSQK